MSNDLSPCRRLLHIDVSARTQGSYSRQLTQTFVTDWKRTHPNHEVTYRDIGTHPIPHINETWVAAYESEPDLRSQEMRDAIALSDTLIDELMAADCYLLGIPMYNLTVPSSFKAYIDQIIRRDRTLQIVNGQALGQLKDKKLMVITTRKFDYGPGSGREDRDFLEPYLRHIFAILGLQDITFIHADQLASPPADKDQSLSKAIHLIHQLAPTF